MKRKREPTDVGVDELADAVLRMIVEKFGDRVLTWETVEQALSIVNFEVKQAAVFAPPVEPRR
jgi:hypothetical protein